MADMNDQTNQQTMADDVLDQLRYLTQGAGTNITYIRNGIAEIERLRSRATTPEAQAVLDAVRAWVDCDVRDELRARYHIGATFLALRASRSPKDAT